jgi:hypothetical protein
MKDHNIASSKKKNPMIGANSEANLAGDFRIKKGPQTSSI